MEEQEHKYNYHESVQAINKWLVSGDHIVLTRTMRFDITAEL
jgi:hypothetical protein